MSFNDYCIKKNISVKDAMRAIDIVVPKIVFLADDGKLVASLTDGDIRRYLLKGGAIEDQAEFAANRSTVVAHNEAEAKYLYHEKNWIAVPIVSKEGYILDIYIGSNNSGGHKANIDVPIVINAGGKGTRLEPYTKILPKPLIPVGELPIIEQIMQRFIEYGCDKFSIIVNYKKELLKAYFADCERKYAINWYDEEMPLGTGGGLCYLKGKMDSTFIFTNCDNLLLSNYDSVMRFHRESKNVITMICALKNITIPYGVIEMAENGYIESMKEKPELSFLTNTGIYVVEPEVLDYIEDNKAVGFPDIIDKMRALGKKVTVYPVSEYEWLDMGQMSELEKMRERLENM